MKENGVLHCTHILHNHMFPIYTSAIPNWRGRHAKACMCETIGFFVFAWWPFQRRQKTFPPSTKTSTWYRLFSETCRKLCPCAALRENAEEDKIRKAATLLLLLLHLADTILPKYVVAAMSVAAMPMAAMSVAAMLMAAILPKCVMAAIVLGKRGKHPPTKVSPTTMAAAATATSS